MSRDCPSTNRYACGRKISHRSTARCTALTISVVWGERGERGPTLWTEKSSLVQESSSRSFPRRKPAAGFPSHGLACAKTGFKLSINVRLSIQVVLLARTQAVHRRSFLYFLSWQTDSVHTQPNAAAALPYQPAVPATFATLFATIV